MSRAALRLLAAILSTASLPARHQVPICGTHAETRREELYLHRQSVKKRALEVRAAAPPAALPDVGQIAIVSDADGVVARRNAFNLQRRAILFLPSRPDAASYRIQGGPAAFDGTASGQKIDGLDDDDTRAFALPFQFPFFGSTHRRVFVNSDGNLTFIAGDDTTSAKTSGKVVSGPPRIAPFFDDLDPSRSAQGVFVLSEAGRFVVTWVKVPEYSDFGNGPLVSLQVGLFPDGRIEFAYDQVLAQNAVVGIAPGSLQGTASFVSYVSAPAGDFAAAVLEVFTGTDALDIFRTVQKFYESHEDAYDYVVIYNGLNIPANAGGAVAYATVTRNDRSGTGDIPADFGAEFGSPRRLQAVLNMGPTSQYPVDPNARVPARGPTGDTPLTVLGHEAGHLFLSYASVRDPADPAARPMLGRDLFHWSFNFNSEASFLEGNRIKDNGPGVSPRFTTTATVEGYSPLDQYLMGFRAPQEVPPMFLVRNSGIASSRAPQVGISFDGQRREIPIDEVIAAEGPRIPDSTVAQRRFRFAFVLVIASGTEPVPSQVDRVDTYRRLFEGLFQKAASDRATADTSLARALTLSIFPAGGVLLGGSGSASLSIANPAPVPLTILLRSQSGMIGVPPSVTLPAGATRVAFTVAGLREGVDDLTAQAADGSHETVFARVRVAPSVSLLQLQVVGGEGQDASPGVIMAKAIQVRVSDSNRIPYVGVQVRAVAAGGGTIQPASAATDENGVAAFRWTPGEGPNRLTLSLESGGSVTLDAPLRPLISAAGVVNAASFAPLLAPGTLASVFGSGLSGEPETLQVLAGGQQARVFAANGSQINFLMPETLPEGPTDLQVVTAAGASNTVQVTLKSVAPGVFFDAGSGFGAIQVNGAAETTETRPAGADDIIVIYATGLGAVRASRSFPGLSETVQPVSVRIGQADAQVLFSGLAPGFPGLYQVNARVPAGLGGGSEILSLAVAGIGSNQVKIRLQ